MIDWGQLSPAPDRWCPARSVLEVGAGSVGLAGGRAAVTGGAGHERRQLGRTDGQAHGGGAGVIDAGSGEVRSLRVPGGASARCVVEDVAAAGWVVYEAGPAGFGATASAGRLWIDCRCCGDRRGSRRAGERAGQTHWRLNNAERKTGEALVGEVARRRGCGRAPEAVEAAVIGPRRRMPAATKRRRTAQFGAALRRGAVYAPTPWSCPPNAWQPAGGGSKAGRRDAVRSSQLRSADRASAGKSSGGPRTRQGDHGARRQRRPGAVERLLSPRDALVKQLRLQPLQPGRALVDQRLAQPHTAA